MHLDRLEQVMQLWEALLFAYMIANILVLFRTGVPDGQPGDDGGYVIAVLVLGTPMSIAFKIATLVERTKSPIN